MARKLCIICGIRKGSDANGFSFKDFCNPCYEESGWENSHNDAGHANIQAKPQESWTDQEREETDGCWICFPELNLAKKPAKVVGAKKQGDRRPQLNHKGHSHPQTPKARRACKAAFWASLTPVVNVSTPEQLSAAMAKWDCKCDAQGVIAKATPMTVVPLGPKGGVINQLKKGPVK